ncbi:MAG: glutamate-5-semialdehyde dehydrogenase, partial [Clostridia bacterium]|nr:glutamate-5-semialdehyde dehydrogenase [Clostridia bacterium]
MEEISLYIEGLCRRAKEASRVIAAANTEKKNAVLLRCAALLRERAALLVKENQKDMDSAAENGVKEVMLDRLRLDSARIEGIAAALEELATLADPIGEGTQWVRPNGLKIRRFRVPLGVIGVIYEARPNVTVDVAALCIKTGNAVVLRGGKEALHSNLALADLLREALTAEGLPADAVMAVARTEREGANALMKMRGLVDLLIPRGGKGLIRAVVEGASVPVIETGAGNCHV